MFKNVYIYLQFIFPYQKSFIFMQLCIYLTYLMLMYDYSWLVLKCLLFIIILRMLRLGYFSFKFDEIRFVLWQACDQTVTLRFKWTLNQLVLCLKNTIYSEISWNALMLPDDNLEKVFVCMRTLNKHLPIWKPSIALRVRSLVVSDLPSETKGSRFKSGHESWAEVSSLQQSPG